VERIFFASEASLKKRSSSPCRQAALTEDRAHRGYCRFAVPPEAAQGPYQPPFVVFLGRGWGSDETVASARSSHNQPGKGAYRASKLRTGGRGSLRSVSAEKKGTAKRFCNEALHIRRGGRPSWGESCAIVGYEGRK